jgi:hypothetical protein
MNSELTEVCESSTGRVKDAHLEICMLIEPLIPKAGR